MGGQRGDLCAHGEQTNSFQKLLRSQQKTVLKPGNKNPSHQIAQNKNMSWNC